MYVKQKQQGILKVTDFIENNYCKVVFYISEIFCYLRGFLVGKKMS